MSENADRFSDGFCGVEDDLSSWNTYPIGCHTLFGGQIANVLQSPRGFAVSVVVHCATERKCFSIVGFCFHMIIDLGVFFGGHCVYRPVALIVGCEFVLESVSHSHSLLWAPNLSSSYLISSRCFLRIVWCPDFRSESGSLAHFRLMTRGFIVQLLRCPSP